MPAFASLNHVSHLGWAAVCGLELHGELAGARHREVGGHVLVTVRVPARTRESTFRHRCETLTLVDRDLVA